MIYTLSSYIHTVLYFLTKYLLSSTPAFKFAKLVTINDPFKVADSRTIFKSYDLANNGAFEAGKLYSCTHFLPIFVLFCMSLQNICFLPLQPSNLPSSSPSSSPSKSQTAGPSSDPSSSPTTAPSKQVGIHVHTCFVQALLMLFAHEFFAFFN